MLPVPVTWAPLGSGPSPCRGSDLFGRSGLQWRARRGEWTALRSFADRVRRVFLQSPCSSLWPTHRLTGSCLHVQNTQINATKLQPLCVVYFTGEKTAVYWLGAHTEVLDVLSNAVVDGGRQRQVEETVCVRRPRQRHDVCVELGEGALGVVIPADVRVPAEEGRQPVRFCFCHLSGKNKKTVITNFFFYSWPTCAYPWLRKQYQPVVDYLFVRNLLN